MRSFTVFKVIAAGKAKGEKNLGGVFVSRNPLGAAKKAASRICRESKIKGQCSLEVHMRETTRGSKKKVYGYKVKRVHNPKTVERDGQEITYKYSLVAKSLGVQE